MHVVLSVKRPPQAHVFELGPRLPLLFGTHMGSFRSGDLLEEVGHWAWALRFCSLGPLPAPFLLPDCGGSVINRLPSSCVLIITDWIPLN